MPSTELLGIYLNDHLAGASAGSELAQKISAENTGTTYGTFLAELARDIEQDHTTLADLMDRLHIDKDPMKEAAGWVLEKFSRLKLSDRFTGSADLKRMLEFETLSLGIEGKRAMWRALKEVSEDNAELAATDLDGLTKRAEDQRAVLEEHRISIAKAALGG
ncbi:MAG TPA: hypothetical protein VFQ77_16110 [Pseudonocardiaceae bacterium]|jgi:hypothetical protein|nr:hypothetical protein [Pseudonocardiaceae bacterium]